MVYINNIPCARYTGGRTSDELKRFLEFIKTDLCDEKVPVKTLFEKEKGGEGEKGKNKCLIYIIINIVLFFILILMAIKIMN
jgi:hypothetical protein